MKVIYALLLVFLLAASCVPARKLIYFSDLEHTETYKEKIGNKTAAKIQSGDLLGVSVSSLNPEFNLLFNNGTLPSKGTAGGGGAANGAGEGYFVDQNGFINFPVLGSVAVAGLTLDEVTSKLQNEVGKSVKNPIINVRLLNFRITVIGEVNSPSTISVPNDRINILEAISLAGDLTPFGKRGNILVIRERNGVRSATRVNLSSKDIFNSTAYHLQQNDIVYVEPVPAKALQSSSTGFYLPMVSLAVSILGILIFGLRR